MTAATEPADSIQNLILTDVLPPGLTYTPGSQTSVPSSTFNQAGQVLTWSFGAGVLTGVPQATVTFAATIDGNASGQLTNEVSATFDYTAPISGPGQAGPISDPITVIVPAISLTKTPSATVIESGGAVTYTYVVTNTGNTALSSVAVTDDKLGSIASGVTLAPGASQMFTKATTLTATTANTGTATGIDALGATVTATAPATVKVIHPGISLTKSPSAPKILSGGSVTYTYVVTNTGDSTLTGVSVTDDKLGSIATGLSLAPGASQSLTKATTLTATTTNTGTAAGVDELGTPVSATATATVAVIHPGISLTKTPSATKILSGGSVTYTYVVTNTGDSPLTGVSVTDDKLGSIASGLTLAPGASQTLTKATTLTATTANTGTATGTDELGNPVTATANANVAVIHPGISLTKTPSVPSVVSGGSVTYTYVVTNTGDSTLTNVAVTDNKLGGIASGVTLAPGASQTFTKATTLTVSTVNTGTASGLDELGNPVTATAVATVTVLTPGISLTKTPSAAKIVSGGSVTYTYVVTNTGTAPLTNVAVTDDKLGSIASGVTLAPGASQTFTKTTSLTASTVNTATATGQDALGTPVSATANANVAVIHPGISLTKTPGATTITSGGSVTYTYVVTNTGDSTLTNVAVSDDKLGVIASGVTLAPGASKTYTKTTTLTATTANTGTAAGLDELGNPVTATANANVVVIHPSIKVEKTPSETLIDPGDSVTYTIVVTNTGDVALTDVEVTDDKLGVIASGVTLAPGASQTFTKTTTLTATTDNTATATGKDPLGNPVTAKDSATVNVTPPSVGGEVLPPTPDASALAAQAIAATLALAGAALVLKKRL